MVCWRSETPDSRVEEAITVPTARMPTVNTTIAASSSIRVNPSAAATRRATPAARGPLAQRVVAQVGAIVQGDGVSEPDRELTARRELDLGLHVGGCDPVRGEGEHRIGARAVHQAIDYHRPAGDRGKRARAGRGYPQAAVVAGGVGVAAARRVGLVA